MELWSCCRAIASRNGSPWVESRRRTAGGRGRSLQGPVTSARVRCGGLSCAANDSSVISPRRGRKTIAWDVSPSTKTVLAFTPPRLTAAVGRARKNAPFSCHPISGAHAPGLSRCGGPPHRGFDPKLNLSSERLSTIVRAGSLDQTGVRKPSVARAARS